VSAKRAANENTQTPGLLPVPRAALDHHLKTLKPSMLEWLGSGKLPPVLLLTGLSGVGKRSIGHFLAQWIFCEKVGLTASADEEAQDTGFFFGEAPKTEVPAVTRSEKMIEPCGVCIECKRALSGSWVDFTEITSDEEDESANSSLKIDQFRKLKEGAGFAAREGGHKIILIPNADRMTTQAANSVLKILEEPPRGWIFFLTASDPTLLLPTVLSRCQQLKLRPMNIETVQELLSESGILGEKQKVAASLSQGSWGRALSLATEDTLEHRQMLFDFLERPQGALNLLVDWAAQTPEKLGLLFDQLELICVDLIRFSVSAGETYQWHNTDGATALKNHVGSLQKKLGTSERMLAFWIARSERIAEARREALAPLNRKLLIQDILMPWLEAAS
jgi:hypothetical protein